MPKCIQITGDSSYGGAGYLVLEWCRYLLARGWEVDVLATDPLWVGMLEQVPGVRVVKHIHIPRDISLAEDARAFGQLLSLMRRRRYDLVHTYTATPGFLGRIAARLAGAPAIVHHQAGWTVTDYSSFLERVVYTPLEFLAVMASTKSICVSHAVAQQALRLHIAPSGKLVTICNGIDPGPFVSATQDDSRQLARREVGVTEGHLLIGNTSRLSRQKDNESLIRAMGFLKPLLANTPFTLVLAGDGPDSRRLSDLAIALGLAESVRFLGFRQDIPRLLAALDVFVNPSLWEGLSISLLEAMAAARPIVTTSIPPNAELVEHEVTGLLVPPQAPEAIARAIARFVHEPGLATACGAAARKRVVESYSVDRMLQETWDLYVSLLADEGLREPQGSSLGGHVADRIPHR